MADEYLPANRVLFVRNIPDDVSTDALALPFGQYPGFREIRVVPGRKGIAFVEYEDTEGAILAKESLAGVVMGPGGVVGQVAGGSGERGLIVTYQRA